MRVAIDLYKKYSDEGLIQQSDVEQLGYPRSLDELSEGVEVGDPQSPERKRLKFLPRIPVDPFLGEARWGQRSYQDDWDSRSWGGENVYDVYSLSEGTRSTGRTTATGDGRSRVARWCRRRDSNPHTLRAPPPQDGVSTNSTTSAAFEALGGARRVYRRRRGRVETLRAWEEPPDR